MVTILFFPCRGSGFHEEFSNIPEARSILIRQVNLLAEMVTASARIQKVILSSLCMHNREPCITAQVPNNVQHPNKTHN